MNIGLVEILIIALICVPILVLSLVGAAVFVNRRKEEARRVSCPFCAERILPEAKVCRYCGRDIPVVRS